MKKLFYICLFISLASIAFAQTYPSPAGHVNDFAGVMSPEGKSRLETLLTQFRAKTGVEIAVAVVKDLGGSDVETYAVELFKRWGIGQKGQDNGLLFLLSVDDRWMRIEVGYGLEGVITDGRAGEIRDKYMVPYLRNNDWEGGITQGVLAAMTMIAQESGTDLGDLVADAPPIRAPSGQQGEGPPGPVVLIFIVLFIFLFIKSRFFRGMVIGMVLGNMLGGGRHRNYPGGFGGGFGGGGGGGFGGFGGGFSGGGGASGRF